MNEEKWKNWNRIVIKNNRNKENIDSIIEFRIFKLFFVKI